MQPALVSLVLQQDGLTLRDVVADIPHDAAAIFVYVLLLAALIAIALGSRRGGDRPGGSR